MSVVTPTITSNGKKMDPAFELLSIDIVKEVNRIPYAQLILLDGDAARQTFPLSDDDFFAPGRSIEIKLRYEGEPDTESTAFIGIVVGHGIEADLQGSLLTIELKDTAVKLTIGRKSQVFRDQSDSWIIAKIAANAGLKKGRFVETQIQHPEMVQYYCTAWDFILVRAEACGLLVNVDDGELSLTEITLQGEAKATIEYGITELYSFALEVDAEHQYAEVQSIAWDRKKQQLSSAVHAKPFALPQSDLDGEQIAKKIGAGPFILSDPVTLNPKELNVWANATMVRNRMSMLRGRIALPGTNNIKPLDILTIEKVGRRFNGKTLVTGVRHRVDQHGWQTDIQLGLPAENFSARQDIEDRPAAGLLPAIHGLHVGIVGKFKEDPDGEYRVSVYLPGITKENEPMWARLASPDAGRERGYFFRPDPGDEVVVGFFNNDPRQAVILGSMYSSSNAPHMLVSQLTESNINKAIVTKKGATIRFVDDEESQVVIETPNQNIILLDDDAQIIQLADQHGNTITMSKSGIEIKSAKDLTIDGSGNVEIKGSKVDIK
jgi:Rhs element Vgr protein